MVIFSPFSAYLTDLRGGGGRRVEVEKFEPCMHPLRRSPGAHP
jgi:hypothetical protein